MNKLTNEAKRVLEEAKKSAARHRQSYAGTEHLLAGLLKVTGSSAYYVLTEAGVRSEKLRKMIDQLIAPGGEILVADRIDFSPRAEAVLKDADLLADRLGEEKTGTEHILLAILQDTEAVATRLLHTMNVDIRKMYADILMAIGDSSHYSPEEIANGQLLNQAEANTTETLDRYSTDLTKLAAEDKLDPVIGRDKEIIRVIEILSRRSKNNPCLIGEPGVGKTAVAEGLAIRIAKKMVPDSMANKRLLSLDISGMVAGSKYRGEFEERIKNVIREASQDDRILLFIDELHTIIGAGGAEGSLDASNILKPALSRGEIQVLGATTIDEYRKHIEKDAALERRFQTVMVEEPSEEATLKILEGLRPYFEKHHEIEIADEALAAAVRLSVRYINDRNLPDKAIDVIDEAASKVRIADDRAIFEKPDEEPENETEPKKSFSAQMEEVLLSGNVEEARALYQKQKELETAQAKPKKRRRRKPVVKEADVAAVVSEWTDIPVSRLAEEETKRLVRLEKELHKRVIGQDEAVRAVAAAIKRGRVGLKSPKRPIGSFLFLGPTGVGKTELSKALSEAVFGSEDNMIRVDMSEYMEKYSVSKLIGSAPGYVGYEEGGQLSEQVRRHPYSVVLFDEIEKAHPDVFNILLQVLDEGHITDSHGRKVDFKNTCIIMTSNAGAQAITEQKHLGFGARGDEQKNYETMRENVMNVVKKMFRPEFLNRIDEIVVFHPLKQEEIEKIVSLLFADLQKRAKEQMNIDLKLTAGAKELIAKQGFSERLGARPIRRRIQDKIETPLADMILEKKVKSGDKVSVGIAKQELTLKVING